MKHLPLQECAYAIVVLVVLAAIYGGAYLAIMQRDDYLTSGVSLTPAPYVVYPYVVYRIGGEWSETFFAPAHEVDRCLRPDLWEGEAEGIRLRRINEMFLSK